jgi:hypothetical protein
MSSDFESAKQSLVELVAIEKGNGQLPAPLLSRNEANTRLQLIDHLIFRCLGWDIRECSAEDEQEKTYADYVLGDPIKAVIWEGKREGIYFELPAGVTKRVCKISTLLGAGEPLSRAVEQVLKYCQKRGVPLAVLCNGHQVIAFLASRTDGVAPLEGQALVYYGLDDINEHFHQFWSNLSKPGVEAFNIHRALRADHTPPPPEKLARRIPGYPGTKNRNAFQAELKTLGQLFIEDLGKTPSKEEDFLRKCYTGTGTLSQYSLISKQILQARYSLAQTKELRLPRVEAVADKTGRIAAVEQDVLSIALSRRPIIIMGDVGVGKTMFLRNLIKVRAKEVLGKGLVLYVDFGKEPALADDLESFVQKRCETQLRTEYGIDVSKNSFVRGVYHGDLIRFQTTIYGPLKTSDPAEYERREIEFLSDKTRDRASHLKSSLEHLVSARKTQVVIFLDNIDQRPVQFQERVFLIGQSLAETWPVAVFLSLRPDTFHHSRVEGALSAYPPRVFTVSPPRIDLVVQSRLAYALDELERTGRLESFPEGLRLTSQSLTQYLHALLESCKESRGLMELLDNLSGGNVRTALTFVEQFVGSGHVDASKIISKVSVEGYTIPAHEFLRAVIYGDHEEYDPSASPICNVFDVSTRDGREHFLLLNLLGFIERGGNANEGYIDARTIFDFAQGLNFHPSQVHFALDRALQKKLIGSNPAFTTNPQHIGYRITTVGAYSLRRLPRMFTYIDAMIVDTPILEDNTRNLIHESADLVGRLDRAKVFTEYLDRQWAKLSSAPHRAPSIPRQST